ncbi:DEAD/DEAH box helicase [Micrococcoides hystricis]|uniref:DEAD/DEAH box helicase n=1 Tax=Micrococcoides hystricis TaxID=1572761 RepID=A0ABV6P798_9MICC
MTQTHPTLLDSLPAETTDPDELFNAFNSWVGSRGLTLYPAQEEAVLELVQGNNVILATPTGSGKSMVAIAAHFFATATGQRSYYTAPIKALVSEKFFDLIDIFGADNVGMITGDSAINTEAPIICCTAEILALASLREGKDLEVGPVIMDEFHFYAEPDRGWAWQVPLLELPQAQFLLMSATLGDVTRFEEELTEFTGRETTTVAHADRPIPLLFEYREETVQDTLVELASTNQAPIYVVHFSQLEAVERAQTLMSVAIISKEQKEKIAEQLQEFTFAAGFGKTLSKMLRAGVGVHHAGMLPKYRRLVERLAQQGLLKVICGTDTLGVGINVPIRTVVLTALSKFDGKRTRHLNAREFHQICGRAGRAGFDTSGTAVIMAPEHVVENKKAVEKAMAKAQARHGNDEKKINQSLRNVTRVKPPSSFLSWSEKTFEKLVASEPEALVSRMKMSHAMLLNLLERDEDPIRALRRLVDRSHETKANKANLLRQALGILRELLATGVLVKLDEPDPYGRTVDLTVELPLDFALNQPLSPFAIAALELLDKDSPSYPLDAVSVFEATLEPPRQVLIAQERKVKDEAMGRLRAEGADYNERMNVLDSLSYPQPLGELLEQQFAIYSEGAPWLKDFEVSPKSVVRDMFEQAMGFSDFIQHYKLARSEGVLLRYLTDAHKALHQSMPEAALTEELEDILTWLEQIVTSTDSSLLHEWEELNAGDLAKLKDEHDNPEIAPADPPLTSNVRAFTVMVRNALFRRVQLFGAEKDRELGALDGSHGFDADAWADALDDYFDVYEDLDDSPAARSEKYLIIDKTQPRVWKVRQIIVDPDDNLDFGIHATVDLDASDAAGEPVIAVTHVGFVDDL